MWKLQILPILFLVALAIGSKADEPKRGGAMDGGGGSRCEASYKLVFHLLLQQIDTHKVVLPKGLTTGLLKKKLSDIEISVIRHPIQKADEPEWKFAWASKSHQNIELYCDEKRDDIGWFSLPLELQKVLALHESLWWVDAIDDKNFSESPRLISELNAKIANNKKQQVVIGSSLYTDVFGRGSVKKANQLYFSNLRKILAAVHKAKKRLVYDAKNLPPLSFNSAVVLGGYVDYSYSYLFDVEVGGETMECTLSVKFKKEASTNEVQSVKAAESCYYADLD